LQQMCTKSASAAQLVNHFLHHAYSHTVVARSYARTTKLHKYSISY